MKTKVLVHFSLPFALIVMLGAGFGRLDTPGRLFAAQGVAASIDFLALGSDGRPVADLKAEEVTLRVDGRNRPIQSLRFVELPAPGTGSEGTPAPPPFGTNVVPAARTVFFAIEDESIRPGTERALRDVIDQMVGRLASSDGVGFATLPKGTAAFDISTDRTALRTALAQVTGKSAASADALCRSRDTLEAFRTMLAALAAVEGPKVVVLFSGGLSAASRAAGAVSSGRCEVTTDHFNRIAPAAAAGRALVYVVHAVDTVTTRNDGLEMLLGVTGAPQVLQLAAAGESPLLRVARETSGYYVATFEADAAESDGQGRRVDLQVTRTGVTARTHAEVVLGGMSGGGRAAMAGRAGAAAAGRGGGGRAGGERGGDPTGGGRGRGLAPVDMLKVTAPFRTLPLRTVGYASRGSGGNVRVMIVAEPIDPTTKLTAGAVGLVDQAGKMRQITLNEQQVSGAQIVQALEVAPGSYRLRVAATDANGRGGAVDYTVDAQLPSAGSLKLSGLVLGSVRGGGFAPTLQFTDEAEAIGYLEVYGQLTGNVSARMEIAKSVDGPAIATIQPGGQRTTEDDKVLLLGQLPIASLEPGDYVIRAYLALEGQPEGMAMRTLRKVK